MRFITRISILLLILTACSTAPPENNPVADPGIMVQQDPLQTQTLFITFTPTPTRTPTPTPTQTPNATLTDIAIQEIILKQRKDALFQKQQELAFEITQVFGTDVAAGFTSTSVVGTLAKFTDVKSGQQTSTEAQAMTDTAIPPALSRTANQIVSDANVIKRTQMTAEWIFYSAFILVFAIGILIYAYALYYFEKRKKLKENSDDGSKSTLSNPVVQINDYADGGNYVAAMQFRIPEEMATPAQLQALADGVLRGIPFSYENWIPATRDLSNGAKGFSRGRFESLVTLLKKKFDGKTSMVEDVDPNFPAKGVKLTKTGRLLFARMREGKLSSPSTQSPTQAPSTPPPDELNPITPI